MSEDTIHIEVPILIPGLTHKEDGCLARLESAFENKKGIFRAQVKNHQTPLLLELRYDPAQINIETIRKIAARAGANIANRYHHESIPVEGMDCSDCVVVLEHGLHRTPGILNASVNYTSQVLQVEYDKQQINRSSLEKRVEQLGYHVPGTGLQSWIARHHEILLNMAGGILLIVAWIGNRFLGLPAAIGTALFLLSYVANGWEISRHTWHSIS